MILQLYAQVRRTLEASASLVAADFWCLADDLLCSTLRLVTNRAADTVTSLVTALFHRISTEGLRVAFVHVGPCWAGHRFCAGVVAAISFGVTHGILCVQDQQGKSRARVECTGLSAARCVVSITGSQAGSIPQWKIVQGAVNDGTGLVAALQRASTDELGSISLHDVARWALKHVAGLGTALFLCIAKERICWFFGDPLGRAIKEFARLLAASCEL
mmetsp:Transcript_101066/g.179341  ORF Transcript_101066/g.179341 Transcript_101066/m.179341 type:complete len:217 (-) Transcript_101066:903-1553(-)